MKLDVKQEKGITMTALVITVITILILTGAMIYNSQDSIYIKKLTNLYSDVELLRDKVSTYYNEYGKIPGKVKYTNTADLSSVLSSQNDIGDFYVIDLEAMQGITLNYGKDYENVKNNDVDANSYTDLYIINENSHNIFYVQGVSIKENNETKKYYTDYIEPDQTKIDLRYIDGILIPDGYYYIGKTKDSSGNGSIVISNAQDEKVDTSKTNQYVWTKQISEIEAKPSSVKLDTNQTENQFIKSVNTYKGYFKNSEGKVQYIVIDEEKWSEPYTKDVEYKDKKGGKVTIPKGFRVSMSPTMNTVENGLVVKDGKDNEWVWVEVPKKVFTTATKSDEYDKIKADLIAYATDYREGSEGQEYDWTDELYEGCGVDSAEEYTEMYQKMLSSVYTNGGFWISRYEIGDSTSTESNTTRTSSSGITGVAVSKPNQIPYNFVTCSEAQKLSSGMSTDTSKTSSLLFGIQWDLTCKFFENNSNLTKYDIKSDSTDWGNYSNTLLKTGASEKTKKLNIYDFAGNECEWTLEKTSDTSNPCVCRGDYFSSTSSLKSVFSRENQSISVKDKVIGFRSTLY